MLNNIPTAYVSDHAFVVTSYNPAAMVGLK